MSRLRYQAMINWQLEYEKDGKLFNKIVKGPREKREAIRRVRKICKENGWTFGSLVVPKFVLILGYRRVLKNKG